MMDVTDHGAIVVCGDVKQVRDYVAEHGLDPTRVIRPGGLTIGLRLRADQVVLLPGWEWDYRDAAWFWQSLATRMSDAEQAMAFVEKAERFGLGPPGRD